MTLHSCRAKKARARYSYDEELWVLARAMCRAEGELRVAILFSAGAVLCESS